MDSRGNIHEIATKAMWLETERRVGKLVEIPKHELESVRALTEPQRVAWYVDQTARKAARKRERNARKRGRRERNR